MTVEILKTSWVSEGGRWTIGGIGGLRLDSGAEEDPSYFKVAHRLTMLNQRPRGNTPEEQLNGFGPTDFFLRQSILPVVIVGPDLVRCIGTAFVLSCTGYVMTAYHVLADPMEREPTKFRRAGGRVTFPDLTMGVVIPLNPIHGVNVVRFFPFEQAWFWGEWRDSPLLHEPARFHPIVDIAICKIPQMSGGMAHQPVNISRFPFVQGETAFAIGYAEMQDIPARVTDGGISIARFAPDLIVSVGDVERVIPNNHIERVAPTPGPCFDYAARIPGKMSGAPIWGGEGAVVRGVVSRSLSGERHATGAMLSPILDFPLGDSGTLRSLMASGNEGIPQIQGPDRL